MKPGDKNAIMQDFAAGKMGFTLDTYWVQAGGADIMKMVKKLHGRLPCVHLKDMYVNGMGIVMAPVGEGNFDWQKIMQACDDIGVKYAFIEQDNAVDTDPLGCMKTSITNLTRLGGRFK